MSELRSAHCLLTRLGLEHRLIAATTIIYTLPRNHFKHLCFNSIPLFKGEKSAKPIHILNIMGPQPSLEKVLDLPTLPYGDTGSPSPANGDYIVKADSYENDVEPLVSGESDATENRIWFKTNVSASQVFSECEEFLANE